MSDIRILVDRRSPLPLYLQIADSLRLRIAGGAIRAGDRLPSLAAAARRANVNLHTVRRAYAELAAAGLVETTRPGGTRVSGAGLPRDVAERQTALQRFVWRMVREARERFNLSPDALAESIGHTAAPRRAPVVTVAECNEDEASEYAQQLMDRWRVVAEPWSLEWAGEPPPGTVITTFFHYNDVRRNWSDRVADLAFVPVHPEPGLRRAIRPRDAGRLTPVILCETRESRSHHARADLGRLLPTPPYQVENRSDVDPAELLAADGEAHLVYPFSAWARLSPTVRASPRTHPLRYVFSPADLDRTGRALGWDDAAPGEVMPRG